MSARKLASYLDVEIPGTYWIDMHDDGTGWRPVEHLPMPHHHATRLELTNAADFAERLRGIGRRARFVIEIRSREICPVAGSSWRATYHAHILEMCAPISES